MNDSSKNEISFLCHFFVNKLFRIVKTSIFTLVKNAIAISLAILILSISMKDLAIYALFKANQTYLTQNVCINRFSPEELCFADCILTQTIIESQEQHDQQSSISLEQQVDVVYVFDNFNQAPTWAFWQQRIEPTLTISWLSSTFLTDIFQPPEC